MSYPEYTFEYTKSGQLTYAPQISKGLYIGLTAATEQEINIPDGVDVIIATEEAGATVVYSSLTIPDPTSDGVDFTGGGIIGRTEIYLKAGTSRKLYLKCNADNSVILNFYQM